MFTGLWSGGALTYLRQGVSSLLQTDSSDERQLLKSPKSCSLKEVTELDLHSLLLISCSRLFARGYVSCYQSVVL